KRRCRCWCRGKCCRWCWSKRSGRRWSLGGRSCCCRGCRRCHGWGYSRCCRCCSSWSRSYTPSHIQERRTDRPPRLEALEVAHAASAHEDNVPAYRQAGSVYGCVDGHGRRIERAVHWDGRAASPGRGVNVIFCCAHVLAECIV